MKWLILCILSLTLKTAFAIPQDSTKVVSLITYLSKGETLNYSILKTRIDSSDTKEPKTTENKFNIKINVTDSTDTSYRLTYYRAVDFLGDERFDQMPKEIFSKLMSLSELKIEYETNELGTFKYILNKEEVLDKVQHDIHELKKLALTTAENEKTHEMMNDFISSIDPNTLLSLYSQDILALHYALGLQYSLSDTLKFEEEIIAPILNIPIKSYGMFYCDEYDAENEYISFMEEKIIDDNFKEKMVEFFQKHENKENPIPVEEFKNMDMNIYISNNYQYNSVFGIPIYIELYKQVTIANEKENLKRIDLYTITLVE